MGSLLRRINRLVKAELNYSKCGIDTDRGVVLAGAGGVAGASIGKIGILAKGTGFSVGTVPLTAAGALTGLALYEFIRAITEGDTSSVGAAAIGAAAGAGVSAAIGNVGIATGGGAIAIGMAPMVVAGAFAGLGIAGLNKLFQQGIDPEKLLELAYEQMQEELMNLRQSTVSVITAQRRIERQYEQAQFEVKKWHKRVQLALKNDNENLARLALERKKSCAENVNTFKVLLDQQTALADVDKLKRNLSAFEAKVSEAKAIKPLLKAQIAAAKAQANLQSMPRGMNTSSAMAAFERMEEKVLTQEAHAQAAGELAGADLESQFAALESSSDIDDELAALKASLPGSSPNRQALPQQTTAPKSNNNEVVDAELEALRMQLDQI